MSRSRIFIATALCFTYLVLAGLVPAVGIYHAFDTGTDNTHHHAIDTCTWLEHSIGSTVLSGVDVDLNVHPLQALDPHEPTDLYLSVQLDLVKARAPPVLLS